MTEAGLERRPVADARGGRRLLRGPRRPVRGLLDVSRPTLPDYYSEIAVHAARDAPVPDARRRESAGSGRGDRVLQPCARPLLPVDQSRRDRQPRQRRHRGLGADRIALPRACEAGRRDDARCAGSTARRRSAIRISTRRVPSECAATAAAHPVDWIYESPAVFYVQVPDTTTGACPAGTRPVYRYFNAATTNHRYTTELVVRNELAASDGVDAGRLRSGAVLSGDVRRGRVSDRARSRRSRWRLPVARSQPLERVLDGDRRACGERSRRRRPRRRRSSRTSHRPIARSSDTRESVRSGSTPTFAGVLVRRRHLAPRARFHAAQDDVADDDRRDVILVVGREAREHDIRAEAVHRQREAAARGEPRIEVGERRRADHEDRVAVGEAACARPCRPRIPDCTAAAALRSKRTSRTPVPQARRQPAAAASSPASKPLHVAVPDHDVARCAVRTVRDGSTSGGASGADSVRPSVAERRADQREPRVFALRDEAAGRDRRPSTRGRPRRPPRAPSSRRRRFRAQCRGSP